MIRTLFIYGLLFNLLFINNQNQAEPMQTYDYETAWKEVKAQENKQLPASALKIVNEIYAAAKRDENTGQLVKAVIHQLKFVDYKEENAFIKNLNRLKTEADKASFPTKPILHSMLAEMYWQYYQNNRFAFLQRSETSNFDDSAIETWSLAKIVKETFEQYHLSLSNPALSKKEDISDFEVIYRGDNKLGLSYQPTLYDFLAHRAIRFFSSTESWLTKPVDAFTLDQVEYLNNAKNFSQLKLETKDEFSMKFYTLKIYQDLIKFHLNDNDPSGLVTLDLLRLQYVRRNMALPNANELYRNSLESLEKFSVDKPISGKVTLEIARTYQQSASLYKPLISDEHKWDFKKAINLCNQAIKRFPDSDGAKACFNFIEDLKRKNLSATIEEQNVPELPFRARVQYQNIDKLFYRIIKTDRKSVSELREKLNNTNGIDREEEFIKHFVTQAPVKKGDFNLLDDKDYQNHSVEVKMDALPKGEYLILFSHHEDFVPTKNGMTYAFTVITNISYVHRNTAEGETEFYVLNRTTGNPIKDVVLKVSSSKYNYNKKKNEYILLGNFTSNAEGYVKIDHLKESNRRNFQVEFRKGDDFNSTKPVDSYRYGSGRLSQYKQKEFDRPLQTFFFLDRAIYRPGQTIHFKGLVIDPDKKNPTIKTNYETTIQLKDVNYQPQGSLKVKTNEFGTFSGTFTAPSNGLTGQMLLNTIDNSGSVYFQVEEYKRPKFYVGFNPVKGEFKLGDEIKVEGFATAYSGVQIDGANVKYRVVRQANFPFWWWCSRGYYPDSPEVEVISGEVTSDELGKFEIAFNALPDLSVDKSSDPTFSYTVYAEVTDINGETHSSSTYTAVGYKSLRVGVNIGTIDKDSISVDPQFAIQTTNQSGSFIAAKGEIKVFRLKMPDRAFRKRLWLQADRTIYSQKEYYDYFPHDQYKDESNQYKWNRAKEVFSTKFNTAQEKSFKIKDLKSWKSGLYVVEIQSTDKSNQAVKEVSYFKVLANSSNKISIPAIHFFQGEKLIAEPGEKASFTIGTSEGKIKVLYELEHDGDIVEKKWMTLKNEKVKIEIPIIENYRGNVTAHYTFVKNNRLYNKQVGISVPHTNKLLDISFETFRNKLKPGEEEQWKIVVKGKHKDKIAAEMVATLYDQSLDEFRANSFYASFYGTRSGRLYWQSINGFTVEQLTSFTDGWNDSEVKGYNTPAYPYLEWFGYSYGRFNRNFRREARMSKSVSAAAPLEEIVLEESADIVENSGDSDDGFSDLEGSLTSPEKKEKAVESENFSEVKIRTNFNETAFFYPHLQTNEKGEIIIKFTIPEALTTWKMLGFAHTKDLKSGYAYNQLVTQKELMVVPNQPRFFREKDHMKFAAKLSSLVDKPLTGMAQLEFFDALTMKSVDSLMGNANNKQSFSLKAKQSTSLEWDIQIPEGLQAISYRIVAKAGDYSDGEEMTLPVVTNRMLVTESLPLPISGKKTKEFRFKKLLENKSNTLRHHRYTLEFTANPAWYAIQSLPYLMEYPYDCVEQTFSKFYANSMATHIANANPKIKKVFDTWKSIQPDALLSNLEKNQELKSALLEETPWVLHAKDESQRKRNVGLLFDLNRMALQQEKSLNKLRKAQTSNGGFSWFPGMPEDRYMTQHLMTGMGHLDRLNVKSVRDNNQTWEMVVKGVNFLDDKIKNDHDRLLRLAKEGKTKMSDRHITQLQLQYLYMRSFFLDLPLSENNQRAFDYFLGQAQKYWTKNTLALQGMACLALNRYGKKATAADIIKSFTERALYSDELGMYWKNDRGYYWYQAPIETQALMIEVYDEVAKDNESVESLKVWLLKQKQTQDWETTKATVEATYALLLKGTDALASSELVEVTIGSELIDPAKREDTKVEAGTGYFKTAWQAGDIQEAMGNIKVTKKDEGVAWGSVYWQYFEELDKITPAETPLKIKKDLFVQKNTVRGPVITPVNDQSSFKVGDLIKVRMELRVDRDMEYVHLKDMRAAGFEPISTLSTHKYQDGLHYYESPRDLATNFFMGYLPKGTYVFEYDLRASQKGDFSNGITTIQCMYAPEFSSHSQGIRVRVD